MKKIILLLSVVLMSFNATASDSSTLDFFITPAFAGFSPMDFSPNVGDAKNGQCRRGEFECSWRNTCYKRGDECYSCPDGYTFEYGSCLKCPKGYRIKSKNECEK